jgi:CubicO group peptidase (beta-lactamase class C family)
MSRRTLILVLILAVLLLGYSRGAPAADAGEDLVPASIWERSTPEEQGIDSGSLAATLRKIRDEKIDIHSVVLIRNGSLVLESYVHPYGPEDLHNVKSVSKSIISALVGIALHRGDLKSLDQKVSEFYPQYFPEDADPRKKAITLRHLLTMTAGLDLDENGPKMGRVFRSDDWIRATFETEMATDPGKSFVYSTPLTHTMSGILTEATGASLREYAGEHLLGPLEIDRLQWQQGPKGYYFGGAELWLTPDAMARFGYLFLNRGRWGDRQVVPAEWVAESTSHQLTCECPGRKYGYWWWLSDKGVYLAMGWGGQGITVAPDLDAVLVITAADHAARDEIAREIFEKAFASEEGPLPPSPEGVKALQGIVKELENPAPSPLPALPETAAKISGKTWTLTGDPRFRSVRFDFENDGRCFVSVERSEGRGRMEVGRDGLFRLTDTGEMGNMPADNRMACRGGWSDDHTFVMEVHEMGNPLVSVATAEFTPGGLDLDVLIKPVGYRISLKGTVPE